MLRRWRLIREAKRWDKRRQRRLRKQAKQRGWSIARADLRDPSREYSLRVVQTERRTKAAEDAEFLRRTGLRCTCGSNRFSTADAWATDNHVRFVHAKCAECGRWVGTAVTHQAIEEWLRPRLRSIA